jgi:2-phospho-L-lactate/phosphoenolpyruvate guanylyltransferase
MIVLIPCKSLRAGKSRLASCLDAAQRHRLCAYFLTRAIELAIAVASAERVRIITPDPDAVSVAARFSVPTFADNDRELNAALTSARDEIASRTLPPQRLMILPIDLPYATADAIAAAARSDADVLIASDEAGHGTNLLLLSPGAGRFRFAFGEESFGAHVRQARDAGLNLQILDDPRLTRDIDEPNQYAAWTKSASFPRRLMTPKGVEAPARDAAMN